jgi:hypothetical protein
MIAFTSPNFSWLDSMRKEPTHVTLFMPTWDLTKLLAANKELELNIDEKEIEEFFDLFGIRLIDSEAGASPAKQGSTSGT